MSKHDKIYTIILIICDLFYFLKFERAPFLLLAIFTLGTIICRFKNPKIGALLSKVLNIIIIVFMFPIGAIIGIYGFWKVDRDLNKHDSITNQSSGPEPSLSENAKGFVKATVILLWSLTIVMGLISFISLLVVIFDVFMLVLLKSTKAMHAWYFPLSFFALPVFIVSIIIFVFLKKMLRRKEKEAYASKPIVVYCARFLRIIFRLLVQCNELLRIRLIPYVSHGAKGAYGFLKTSLRSIFKIRTEKASATERVVLVMGWIHLLFLILAIPLKFILLLYFMSAGWATALQSFIGLFSGKKLLYLTAMSYKNAIIVGLGTIYGLYHIILISLFLVVLRKGAKRSTYFFSILSIIILILFTIMGFNFSWT